MEKKSYAVSVSDGTAFKFTVFYFGLPKHSNPEV